MSDEHETFSPYRTDGKLYGFICIVTNAHTSLGVSIVSELASHGAASIYACIPPGSSSTASDTLKSVISDSPSTQMVTYPANTSREEEVLQLIDDVLNACGRLDVWVCTTAMLGPSSIENTGLEEVARVSDANVAGPFLALKHGRRAMEKKCSQGTYPKAQEKKGAYGSIIVVGSTASSYGGCWGPAYTMAQHAALGVVKSGVAVLKGTSIRINYISAGQIDIGVDLKDADKSRAEGDSAPPSQLQAVQAKKTNTGLERAGTPSEVARVVGFLSSGFSSYMTGANLTVDGGSQAMCPLTAPI